MTDQSVNLSDNRISCSQDGSVVENAVGRDRIVAVQKNSEDENPRIFPTVRTVVALGDFDGVHIAHVKLLRTAVRLAGELDASAAVFTFLQSKGEFITDFDEKIELIRKNGIDLYYAADFAALRNMSPSEFVEKILLEKMGAVHVVCGYNFRFGKYASGDADTLEALCKQHGVGVSVIERVTLPGGDDVSSSQIRDALRDGNVEYASKMLGRAFSMRGVISHGRAVGRQNECPTLNLIPNDSVVTPKNGVYFTKCTIDGRVYPSISNIGVRPTFDSRYGESYLLCEVHLLGDLTGLDIDDGLYGRPIKVEFDRFCRPEIKFESPRDLYSQIEQDVRSAIEYYG